MSLLLSQVGAPPPPATVERALTWPRRHPLPRAPIERRSRFGLVLTDIPAAPPAPQVPFRWPARPTIRPAIPVRARGQRAMLPSLPMIEPVIRRPVIQTRVTARRAGTPVPARPIVPALLRARPVVRTAPTRNRYTLGRGSTTVVIVVDPEGVTVAFMSVPQIDPRFDLPRNEATFAVPQMDVRFVVLEQPTNLTVPAQPAAMAVPVQSGAATLPNDGPTMRAAAGEGAISIPSNPADLEVPDGFGSL